VQGGGRITEMSSIPISDCVAQTPEIPLVFKAFTTLNPVLRGRAGGWNRTLVNTTRSFDYYKVLSVRVK
jgi:hypothetical protein